MPVISAGGGGGAAYTPPITRAQYATSPTPVTIANNAQASLTWVLISGTALLNVTSPALPTIVTAGTYAVTVQVTVTAMTAGGYFTVALDLDASGDDPQLVAFSPIASATLTTPSVLLAMTYYIPAAGEIMVAVTNKDGVAARDFSLALAAVQRLS